MAVKVDEKCRICAHRASFYCLATHIFQVIFKGAIGLLTGSLALIADATYSMADVLCSIVSLVTTHFAEKPPDKKHPYGHGKMEFICGTFIGIVLFTLVAFIVVVSIAHLITVVPHPPPHFVALIAVAVSILINEMMFRCAMCPAKRVNSAAVEAEAWDSRSAGLSSVAVFVGVLGAQFGLVSLDPLAAILVGIFVAKISLELIYKNLTGLMDTSLHSDEINQIRELVITTPGVKSIGYLKTRAVGRRYTAEIQILVSPTVTVEESHIIVSRLKTTLRQRIEHLEDIVITCKPYVEELKEVA